MRIKGKKEFWDARTSKKMKKLGLAIGAAGASIVAGAMAFESQPWLLKAGFIMTILGAPISILFTDDPS